MQTVKRKITNRKYAAVVASATAGDQLHLKPGNYYEPLVIDGKSGTASRPLVIEPESGAPKHSAIFQSEMSADEARLWSNAVADRRQRAGYYPVVGHLADQAMLILRNCQFVVIRHLKFLNCWPGAIYLDNCQHILIDDVHFKAGTIAIGANGIFTRDIIVQRCFWQQDTSGEELWSKIPWGRIHGASSNSQHPGVDVQGDYRHWDGDFFRAWDIAGNVIIRNNQITDAFNAIHFFNSVDRLAPGVMADQLKFNNGRRSSANVLIENNDFVRIRDNVFEPEDHAWNWVIRRNRLIDCYRPFSFEFERAGHFYIYANTGTFSNRPSQALSDTDKAKIPKAEWRQTMSLFKPKGKQANEGNLYVFYNSWYYKKGKGILPKFALGRLVHVNNAIQYANPENSRMFGGKGDAGSALPLNPADEIALESHRFTRRWLEFNIRMDGDISNASQFPDQYRDLGYAIGPDATQAPISFAKTCATLDCCADYTLTTPAALNTSIAFNLELPDGTNKMIPAGNNRGAVQNPGVYDPIDKLFRFLPDDSWLLNVPGYEPLSETACTIQATPTHSDTKARCGAACSRLSSAHQPRD